MHVWRMFGDMLPGGCLSAVSCFRARPWLRLFELSLSPMYEPLQHPQVQAATMNPD